MSAAASSPEAGPSTIPTSDNLSPQPPSASTSTSSRKSRRPPARGVSLGLEEEVEFGSDEDLMENVGEIDVPITNTWYPGRPDSPKGKKGKGLPTIGESAVYGSKSSLVTSSSTSSRSRSGFMGKKDKTRGLGDARLVIPEDFVAMSPSPSIEMASSVSGRISREASEMSVSTGSVSSKMGLKKDKNKSKVFGKLFGKKKDEDNASAGGRSMASDSVESFGSGSRYSETSAPRSILVTSAHVPPTHTPRSQASSDVPSTKLPSIPTTPFSFDSRVLPLHRQGTHSKQESGSSGVPLIHAMELPGTDNVQENESLGTLIPAMGVSSEADLVPNDPSVKRQRSNDGNMLKSLAPQSGKSQQSLPPPSAFPEPAKAAEHPFHGESTKLSDLLLPPFPTSESVLETITILSANVMRRMPTSQSSPDKRSKSLRPGTASSIATSFGSAPRKAMWQTHQLVLTSFRINETSPYTSPNPALEVGSSNHRRQTSTQTIAHLHLFAYNTASKSSSRPGSATTNKKRLGSLEGAVKVEVDRQVISAITTAGVWESSDEAEADTLGRKWILRVRFGEDQEEWLCDMPTGDTLFEWVRQIKAYATVVKAETLGFGAAIRSAHSLGATDLNLELELHEQGLKSTPRPLHSALLPLSTSIDNVGFSPDFDQDLTTPNAAEAYRAAMIAQGHAYDSPSAQPPISMHDFFMRKSLSPKGQDLATFLDHADIEWRMRQAEKIRETRALAQQRSTMEGKDSTGNTEPVAPVMRQKAPALTASALPPAPPPQARPPPVPAPSDRLPAIPPPNSHAPPVPPPRLPLPAIPLPARVDSLGISVDDSASPISPSGVVAAQAIPDLGQEVQSSSTSTQVIPAMKDLSLKEADSSEQGDQSELQPPRLMGRSLTNDSLSGLQAGDDAASISSRGSSSVIRRGGPRRPQAAVDLMAELSGRREMNYEKPEELKEDTTPIDENRPRKIRFG